MNINLNFVFYFSDSEAGTVASCCDEAKIHPQSTRIIVEKVVILSDIQFCDDGMLVGK